MTTTDQMPATYADNVVACAQEGWGCLLPPARACGRRRSLLRAA